MALQTAVEWLCDKLLKGEFINNPDELLEQAKQMEREQHGDTWDAAIKAYEDRGNLVWRSICDFDDYYTQTYSTRLQNETN